ncbi:MAG: flavodoxin family protein [Halobacteriota archaeon]
MNTLIVYASVHHKNTEKVAKVIAAELGADLVSVGEAQPDTLTAYDLIGFGSGIYYMKFHKTLLQFVEALPSVTGKRAFIFSTSGEGGIQRHATLKELLMNRGFSIVGDFSCTGCNTWGPLKLVGGTNKGRPNADDLEEARVFARGLKEKYS